MNSRFDPVHPDMIAAQEPGGPHRIRPVIGAADGSSTLAWYMALPPSACAEAYLLSRCDEIVALVAGRGVADLGGAAAAVRAGHCWLTPPGVARCFRNESTTRTAVLVGFCPGAPDLEAGGYRALDRVKPAEGRADAGRKAGPVMVHVDDAAPQDMDAGKGWSISDFRLPLGHHNGSSSTLFRARFLPGAIHRKHRHQACEEIYFVIGGQGIAGAGDSRSTVRGGHFHYIPAGTEHWLVNRNGEEPVEVVGIYVGAGSVEETGYVYCGDVTAADLDTGRGRPAQASPRAG